MQRQFFQFVGDFDAFIDLFELEVEKVFEQFGAEGRLPVDEAADEQFYGFLVEVQLPAAVE